MSTFDYTHIYNPYTGRKVSVQGAIGKRILKRYVNQSNIKENGKNPKIKAPSKSKTNTPSKPKTNTLARSAKKSPAELAQEKDEKQLEMYQPTKRQSNLKLQKRIEQFNFQCSRFKTISNCILRVMKKIHSLEKEGHEVKYVSMMSTILYGKMYMILGDFINSIFKKTDYFRKIGNLVSRQTTQCSIFYYPNQQKDKQRLPPIKVKCVNSKFYRFSYDEYVDRVAKEINSLNHNGQDIVCVISDEYLSFFTRRTFWYTCIFYR